jgi:hypothetical protein
MKKQNSEMFFSTTAIPIFGYTESAQQVKVKYDIYQGPLYN